MDVTTSRPFLYPLKKGVHRAGKINTHQRTTTLRDH